MWLLQQLHISDERRCGDATMFGRATPDPQSLEVDILCFSGGDGEHPWTRKSTVLVKDDLKADDVSWDMTIEIHTNLLAVLLTPRWPDRSDKELRVFEWRTGEEIAVSDFSMAGMNV